MNSNRAGKALIGFLLLMVALTVVSRVADSLTICRVTTTPAKAGALLHKIESEGKVEAVREHLVWATPGLRVAQVCAIAGTRVAQGDVLARFEEASVLGALRDVRMTLKKLESQHVETVEMEMASTLLECTRAVADAEKTYKNAKKKKEKTAAKQKLDRARENLTLTQTSLANKRAQEIETLDALAMEIYEKEQLESTLMALYRQDSALVSPADGIVCKCNLEAGKESTNDVAVRIADDAYGLRLTLSIPLEQAKVVQMDSACRITKPGEKKSRDARIEGISSADGDGNVRVTIALDDTDYTIGASIPAVIEQKTDRYTFCLPQSALRGDNTGDFVLVLSPKSGVLGDSIVAERVVVTVLDRDGERAAVEGALYDDVEVIIEADKPIAGGDRVRPIET